MKKRFQSVTVFRKEIWQQGYLYSLLKTSLVDLYLWLTTSINHNFQIFFQKIDGGIDKELDR